MKRALSFLLTAAVAAMPFVAPGTARAAEPGSTWSQAKTCFNDGHFRCAFDSSMMLYRAGQITPGTGMRTSDTMGFLQVAFVEAAARAKPKDFAEMVQPIIKEMGKHTGPSGRLPFVYGFAALADAQMCGLRGNTSCMHGFERLYCHVKDDLPPPSWPQLAGVNPLSDVGRAYYTKVMATLPTCEKS